MVSLAYIFFFENSVSRYLKKFLEAVVQSSKPSSQCSLKLSQKLSTHSMDFIKIFSIFASQDNVRALNFFLGVVRIEENSS